MKYVFLCLFALIALSSLVQAYCGDNYCMKKESETITNCPSDCTNNQCGNGICSNGENADNCPVDCYYSSTNRNMVDVYHTRDQVYNIMFGLESQYPGMVKHEVIGKSIQGRNIYAFVIGTSTGWRFMFDGRLHGMEDCGTEAGMKFIQDVLAGSNADLRNVRDNTQLIFIPVVNVDSTRRQNMRRTYPDGTNVVWGVDLNRNFVKGWGGDGSSDPADAFEYRGEFAGSEPETQAIRYALQKYKPQAYINVHCGGERMMNGKIGTPVAKKILENMNSISAATGASTMSLYNPTISTTSLKYYEGTGIAASDGAVYSNSSWIIEMDAWNELPKTLDGFLTTWYKQVYPIYLAMALNQKVAASTDAWIVKGNWTLRGTFDDAKSGADANPVNVVFTSDSTYGAVANLYTTSSVLEVPYRGTFSTGQRFSVEAQVKADTLRQGYIARNEGGWLLQIVQKSTSEGYKFQGGIYSGGVWKPLLFSKTSPQVGKWYRVEFSYDNGRARLYVNGVLEADQSFSLKADSPSDSTLYFGNNQDDTRWLDGKIIDVAVKVKY